MKKIYISILNYNGFKDTIECIESILKNNYNNYQLIIVDNNSTDNSLKFIIEYLNEIDIKYIFFNENEILNCELEKIKSYDDAKVILIKNNENKGFSGGNNVAIKYALIQDDFEYIWLLNNDIIINSDTIEKIVNTFNEKRKKENIGLMGTIQLYYDKKEIIQAAAGKFNKLKGAFLNYGEGKNKNNFKLEKFDYIYGASIVLHKNFIKTVGLLNEEYFMYYEEIDLAQKAKKYNFKITIAENVFIYHKFSKTVSQIGQGFRIYYLQRNKILFYKKYFKFYLPFLFLFQIKDLIFSNYKKEFIKGMIDGYFNRNIKQKEKLLIVEMNDFHEEVIYSLAKLLRENYEIILCINNKIFKKGLNIFYDIILSIPSNKIIKFLILLILPFYLKLKKINKIIYNTYEDKYVKIISNLLPKSITQFAILHNLDKFNFNNKNINNIIVLSELLYKNFKKLNENIKTTYFYPIIYDYNNNLIENNPDIIKICIPGKIEYKRRNYKWLAQYLVKNKLKKIKFVLLGNISTNDGMNLLDFISKNNIKEYFIVFKNFIPYDKYFNEIANSDLIMPLIHPDIELFENYKTTKITASFNMAFSFKKPLLMYNVFNNLEEFKEFSIFYSFDNLFDILSDKDIKIKINKKIENIKNCKKFNLVLQQKRLIKFLNKE